MLDAYIQVGRESDAESIFKEIHLSPGNSLSLQEARLARQQGELALLREHPSEALKIFLGIQSSSSDYLLLSDRAFACIELGKWPEAQRYMAEYRHMFRAMNSAESCIAIGLIRAKSGDWKGAREAIGFFCEQASSDNPALFQTGRLRWALPIYRRLAEQAHNGDECRWAGMQFAKLNTLYLDCLQKLPAQSKDL